MRTGFDKSTFVQGSTANALNALFIKKWHDAPIFAKQELETDRRNTTGSTAWIFQSAGQGNIPFPWISDATLVARNLNKKFPICQRYCLARYGNGTVDSS
ncbi:hypothetical protein LX36DRAFT_748616 [Colletotrichum falcatum]|nr:hypothetical protein LX36DRAFT_748616 [Colletotrichum falcatum]